jgi:hypothetical protein
MSPANPLPWIYREDEFGVSICYGPEDADIHIARLGKSPDSDSGRRSRRARPDDVKDAAYLIHAANAYPTLVATLRQIAERVPPHVNGDGATESARAVLRALGELPPAPPPGGSRGG